MYWIYHFGRAGDCTGVVHSYIPTFRSLVRIRFEGVFSMNLTFFGILSILWFGEVHREHSIVLPLLHLLNLEKKWGNHWRGIIIKEVRYLKKGQEIHEHKNGQPLFTWRIIKWVFSNVNMPKRQIIVHNFRQGYIISHIPIEWKT